MTDTEALKHYTEDQVSISPEEIKSSEPQVGQGAEVIDAPTQDTRGGENVSAAGLTSAAEVPSAPSKNMEKEDVTPSHVFPLQEIDPSEQVPAAHILPSATNKASNLDARGEGEQSYAVESTSDGTGNLGSPEKATAQSDAVLAEPGSSEKSSHTAAVLSSPSQDIGPSDLEAINFYLSTVSRAEATESAEADSDDDLASPPPPSPSRPQPPASGIHCCMPSCSGGGSRWWRQILCMVMQRADVYILIIRTLSSTLCVCVYVCMCTYVCP